jgi:hypothetical protein
MLSSLIIQFERLGISKKNRKIFEMNTAARILGRLKVI